MPLEGHDKSMGIIIDPSTLTTAQLLREIASLKELMLSHIDRIDSAVVVAHQDLVRVPTDVQKAVENLKSLTWIRIDEMEKLVNQRFGLVETSRVEQKTDTATAVTAALNAAKEAVAEQNKSNTVAISKSEAATTKQIDGVLAQVYDLKDRLTRIEGITSGKKDFWGYIIGVVGLLAAIGSIIAMVIEIKK